MTAQLFHPEFSSTDDPDRDAELILIEDTPRTIEEIFAVCRKYGVRARVVDLGTGRLIGEVRADGIQAG